jgi:hypothetical protein
MTKQINKDEDEKEVITPTDLDAVHEKAIHDLETGDSEDDDIKDKGDQDDDDAGEVKDKKDEKELEEEEEPKVDKDQLVKEVDKQPEDEVEDEELKPKEFDKIKVKDYEGNEHEFATIDEVPDDFEPSSYKEWGKAVKELTIREDKVAKEEERINQLKSNRESQERIKKIQEEWDKEIEALTKEGALAKDEAERKEMIDEVYRTMRDEMDAGRRIDSFTQAYEITAYRKFNEDKTKRKQEVVKEKKTRGGRVLSSGGAAPSGNSSNAGKTFEAPPSGVSLDDVHAKVLGSL